MKKLRSILVLALALGFVTSLTLTSCGGKKEEATEQMEGEHPEEGGEHPSDEAGSEHPSEGGEHPASDTTITH